MRYAQPKKNLERVCARKTNSENFNFEHHKIPNSASNFIWNSAMFELETRSKRRKRASTLLPGMWHTMMTPIGGGFDAEEREKKVPIPFHDFMLCLVDKTTPGDDSAHTVCTLNKDMRSAHTDPVKFAMNDGRHTNDAQHFCVYPFVRSVVCSSVSLVGQMYLALYSRSTRTMLAVSHRPIQIPQHPHEALEDQCVVSTPFKLLDDQGGAMAAYVTWTKAHNDWVMSEFRVPH